MAAEILPGLWRFEAVHPEWEDENDGWEPEVGWWAVAGDDGATVLIDPLIVDWQELDGLIASSGGCAGIIRTTWWHQRTIAEAAQRYGAEVWARPAPPSASVPDVRFDRPVGDQDRLPGGLAAYMTSRDDELAIWLPRQRALVFGDVMIRSPTGELQMCPESWLRRDGGRGPLRASLAPLIALGAEHALVSHGPLVLGDGGSALARALAA